ncbi:MAG: beta-ketoacyl synthase chain length factor [Spirochaetes bacterium]|nr:beta-ketoacyl synthase chain length factor [Spirochaetota bacterium]
MQRLNICQPCFINSISKQSQDLKKLFAEGFFDQEDLWQKYPLAERISDLKNGIQSSLTKRMSQLSLGVYQALSQGGAKDLREDDEIYFFTCFAEIDTTNTMIHNITVEQDSLVSPTLFHNSVHNTPLGYFTIINKAHNYCTTISEGLDTNLAFVEFLKYILKIPKRYIIVAGDEYSPFLKLDPTKKLDLYPFYCSFVLDTTQSKGIKYLGEFQSFNHPDVADKLDQANAVFVNHAIYQSVKKQFSQKTYTEYPLMRDNPCGIIVRLILPVLLDLQGSSIVIEEIKGRYFIFEV